MSDHPFAAPNLATLGLADCPPPPPPPPPRVLRVEALLKRDSAAPLDQVESALRRALKSSFALPLEDCDLPLAALPDAWLALQLERVAVVDTADPSPGCTVSSWHVDVRVHAYQLAEADGGGGGGEEQQAGDGGPRFRDWSLPHRAFDGGWDALLFDGAADVKARLLSWATAALAFASRGVSPYLCNCSKVALLHGPPGTGKTSLCAALAQKLAVRLRSRFPSVSLVEVNAHSLFSKWFSESGKRVAALFAAIEELADNPAALVVVVVDEVESLSAARRSGGSEPADSIRVVNALLTALDALKRRTNVLLLCTSNLSASIDVAFVDRADGAHAERDQALRRPAQPGRALRHPALRPGGAGRPGHRLRRRRRAAPAVAAAARTAGIPAAAAAAAGQQPAAGRGGRVRRPVRPGAAAAALPRARRAGGRGGPARARRASGRPHRFPGGAARSRLGGAGRPGGLRGRCVGRALTVHLGGGEEGILRAAGDKNRAAHEAS